MVAKTAPVATKVGGRQGQAFKDKSKPADIRQSNINAAKGRNLRNTRNYASIIELIAVNYSSEMFQRLFHMNGQQKTMFCLQKMFRYHENVKNRKHLGLQAKFLFFPNIL